MKRFLLNVVLMILAFTVQNCVFPLIPFLTATPNLLLIYLYISINGNGDDTETNHSPSD